MREKGREKNRSRARGEEEWMSRQSKSPGHMQIRSTDATCNVRSGIIPTGFFAGP